MASASQPREQQQQPLHILVVGAGAVGCFYASRLHNPSNNVFVSLVCRSNYKTIAEKGVELETHSFGNYHFTPHAVFASIDDAAAAKKPETGQWDYVVVTTKALPDVTNDAHDIRRLVTPGIEGSCTVLIQNGVGVEEVHRETFPENPIVSAVTVISAEQVRHGFIRQNRWTRISMGCFTNGTGSKVGSGEDQAHLDRLSQVGDAKVRQLVSLFTDGSIKDAEFYDEVGLQLVRWHKICINGSMNPSAVLSGGTGNARMSLDPELRRHLHACMQEIFDAVPKVLGRQFPDKLANPEKILKSTERNTKGKPSMLLDWQANRPMELEVILGNPVRIARRHGVEMPRLQSLYALLKMAQTRRDEDLTEAKAKL